MNWQTSSGAHASLAIDGTHVRNFGPCINAPSGLGRKANLRPEGSWYKVPRDRDGGLALYPQLQFVASRDIGEGEELLGDLEVAHVVTADLGHHLGLMVDDLGRRLLLLSRGARHASVVL